MSNREEEMAQSVLRLAECQSSWEVEGWMTGLVGGPGGSGRSVGGGCHVCLDNVV